MQHLDFINTFSTEVDRKEPNMWHWYTSLSAVRVIHNSKITYERRIMQMAEGKPSG
jgi:hypothetical protein